jgi:hypothetical protein
MALTGMALFVALNILAVESEFAPCLLELESETFDGDLYSRTKAPGAKRY